LPKAARPRYVFFRGTGAILTENTQIPNQILCPYCNRSIALPSIKYGSQEKCPHCNHDFVVSHRLIPPEKLAPLADAGEEYELKANSPPESPRGDLAFDLNRAEEKAGDLEEEAPSWRPMQAPFMELFLKGTFSFPFSAKSRGSLIILSILCFATFTMADSAIYNSQRPGWISQDFARLFTYISVVLGVFLLVVFSAFGIAILSDASEGFEKFVTMRLDWSFAWLEEPAYIAVNLFWGSVPASILLLVLPDSPSIKIPIYVLSEMILFPIFLLSALAGRSCVMPYSRAVWQSLRYAWHAWALFYLLTLLLGEALVYFWRVLSLEGFWTEIIILSALPPVFWIVYFRLLGRLALFCSGRYDEIHPPK